MKNFFSSMLAIVALSFAFTSCGNNGGGTYNNEEPATTQSKYITEYKFTEDIFKIFDIEVVKTVGESKTVVPFKKEIKIGKEHGLSTGMIKVKAENGEKTSVQVIITLKSNWKEVLSAQEKAVLQIKYKNGVFGKVKKGSVSIKKSVKEITDEDIQEFMKLVTEKAFVGDK